MTTRAQEAFLNSAAGKYFNPDNAYGYQCKDLADAYCIAIFGNWQNTIRAGNGKDVFANANPANFTKIANDPRNPAQIPARGDIINWGASRAVPEGHVAVVLSADQSGVTVLQQDGYTQTAAAIVKLPYTLASGAVVIGWLRPNLAPDAPATTFSRTVTAPVGMIRTAPRKDAPLAPGFPEGIAQGATLAVVGYVQGQDPFGTGDDAWFQTRSGYYIWANGAGNSLAGLPKLN